MATTTNYSWTTPDDTALVKDGAAAIRTLGSAIDTTTKNLNPSTTLGDIEYRSATANTNTRLGIGSAGQVLTVSGGVPAWATPATGGITLISTTSLSGATVTLSSIPSTYNHLFLLVYGMTNATGDGAFRIAPNAATTSTTNVTVEGGTTPAMRRGAAGYLVPTLNDTPLRTDANNVFAINFFNYAGTAHYKPVHWTGSYVNGSSVTIIQNGAAVYTANTAISSLVLSNAGGNLSTGTALLYGVK